MNYFLLALAAGLAYLGDMSLPLIGAATIWVHLVIPNDVQSVQIEGISSEVPEEPMDDPSQERPEDYNIRT